MRFNPLIITAMTALLAGLAGGGRPCRAQTQPPAPAVPAGPPQGFTRYNFLRGEEDFGFLRNDSLRTDFFDPLKYIPLSRQPGYYLTLGADIRYQYEAIRHENWGAVPPDGHDTDGYLLQRHMLHTDWRLGSHLRVFAQLLSTNVQGRTDGPRPELDRDELDLYQAFANISAPLGRAQAVLRVGRQEFNYGSGLLLSMREGPNTRQSFDAVRLALTRQRWRVDALVGRPLFTRPGVFDDRGFLSPQLLWGVYATRAKSLPPPRRGGFDVFYFGLNKDAALFLQGVAPERRHSAGLRWWRDPAPTAPLGYDLSVIGQLGTFGVGRIRAYYASAVGYYQLARWPLTPTFRYATNVISGDDDPNNPNLQTFNALYPRPYFGTATTPIGPGNLIDVHPGVELHFTPKMTLLVDLDWLWRYSARDGIYTPSVFPVIPLAAAPGPPLSSRRYIGRQFNADYAWQATRHLALGLAYAWIPAGDYLQDQTPGLPLSYFRSTALFQF